MLSRLYLSLVYCIVKKHVVPGVTTITYCIQPSPELASKKTARNIYELHILKS